MLQINVKDKAFVKYVEASVSRQDMLAFVCEDPSDQDKLLQELREKQNLRVNVVGMPKEPLSSFRPPAPIESFRYRFIICPLVVVRYRSYSVYT